MFDLISASGYSDFDSDSNTAFQHTTNHGVSINGDESTTTTDFSNMLTVNQTNGDVVNSHLVLGILNLIFTYAFFIFQDEPVSEN